MKLKRLLSASLMLASLAGAAAAQRTAAETREGDAFHGPVKSVRIERVMYDRSGGALLEGPRRLVSTSTYAPDGKRKEHESYAPDGTLAGRRVHVYDEAGHEVEQSYYDGGGVLQSRVVRRPALGETLMYKAGGVLRERRLLNRGPDGTSELRIYDGAGALRERTETKTEGGVSVSRTYGPDGVLKKSAENGPGGVPGRRRSVLQTYNPDGTVYGRRVTDLAREASALEITADNVRYNPGPRKTRETREHDARGNLSRLTSYVLNEATGEYEPTSVTYYTIDYYR